MAREELRSRDIWGNVRVEAVTVGDCRAKVVIPLQSCSALLQSGFVQLQVIGGRDFGVVNEARLRMSRHSRLGRLGMSRMRVTTRMIQA